MQDARHLLANDDIEFVPTAQLAKEKLDSFNKQAPVRKSKLEKEREAAAKKAKDEEEDAAKAYEAFVASFGGDDDDSPSTPSSSARAAGKSFVRAGGAGGYNPLRDRERETSSPAQATPKGPAIPTGPRALTGATAGGSYGKGNYQGRPGYGSGQSTSSSSAAGPSRLNLGEDEDTAPKPLTGASKKKRDMDKFLEELKRDQKEREDRLAHHAGRSGSSVTALAAREYAPVLTGSYDAGDPLTTNIHVGNLPLNVTEESLGMLFAEYGPVGSVKIMWPRNDPTVSTLGAPTRRSLGGFVSFMRRPDAEKAAKGIDGLEWGGNVLRTGWGKAVPTPSRAVYELERRRRSPSRSRSRSRSRSPDRSRSHGRRRRDSRSSSRSRSPPPRERAWPILEEGTEKKFLEAVASKIIKNGRAFEEVVRSKEKDNERFRFFWDQKLPSYEYFKMLLDDRYVPKGPNFVDEGNADAYSSDSAEDSERERVRKGKLGKLAKKRFGCMLRGLTSTRDRIARAMAFALEHADAANIIVDILVGALTLEATPVPRKIARLHLVSDILHNASASLPNAWTYRSILEERLLEVFDHLGDIYLSFPGRMKAEQFRIQVTKIVDVWERDWIVFEPGVIEDMRRRLSGQGPTHAQAHSTTHSNAEPESELTLEQAEAMVEEDEIALEPASAPAPARGGFKVATFQPAAFTAPLENPDLDGEGVDVDGEAVDVDVDGEEVDVDGAEVDVDGEAVDVDGDALDGENIDVDGEPVAPQPTVVKTIVLEDDDDDMEIGGDSDQDIF